MASASTAAPCSRASVAPNRRPTTTNVLTPSARNASAAMPDTGRPLLEAEGSH